MNERAPEPSNHFDSILNERLDRRDALKRLSWLSALVAWPRRAPFGLASAAPEPTIPAPSTLTFEELAHGADDRVHVAQGYSAAVLISWGDPLFNGAPRFDASKLSRAAQERQLGTETDFLAYFPLPKGSRSSTRGLLCINHEGSNPELMFADLTRENALERMTREQIEIEMAAQGHSIVEIERVASTPDDAGGWRVVTDSHYTRRITGTFPPMHLRGPVAGHARLKTKADPDGRIALGALNCCSGGQTPWDTLLIGEENVNQYFHGDARATREARNHARMAVGTEENFAWSRVEPRFDLAHELNEPNRFGWVIELDPYDPQCVPVRRTALGRFKHEGATCVIDPDGRIVVYMGDDDEFEFVYKFVTRGVHDPAHPEKSRDLLDDGVLFAARFESDGTLRWLPLVHGHGPLTKENGFETQADVLIEARHAATLLGATPMDRPEDVETNPTTGLVYVMLTKNKLREAGQIDAANPRALNLRGHVIELAPPPDEHGQRTHAAEVFRWELFLKAGDPFGDHSAAYHPLVSKNGWLACPDNCAFDPAGRLWISTDGMSRDGLCNGVYAMDTRGDGRALPRHFFRGPLGGEISGPCFTPDGRTLFVSVQHPGQSNALGKKVGTFAAPTTRFPDYDARIPPRPSVIAITKLDGGAIGS